ncbi:MAG: hypothetical protein HYX29_05775 [Solirubrobacterales bacterium]|nr:hypothetical protein [Solirubrobacterales bacterium]
MTLLVFALANASGTSAIDQASGPDSAPLRELPDLVLKPWLDTQTKNGNFNRPSGTPAIDGYGNAGIAYGMLQEAARTGDMTYLKSAMRTFSWITRTRQPMNGVFYQMFSASAYNFARANFAGRPEFKRIRVAWANQLRRFPYQRGVLGSRYHYNKNLVEALEVIELYNSGLRGNARNAILRDRKLALRRALRLIDRLIPARVKNYTQSVGPGQGWPFTTTVADMSDPPANPPAYNAFVAGVYARAYQQLAPGLRTERMRLTSETLIRGVIARTAPDGDIAFDGRSQEQAWALSLAGYAAWSASSFATGTEREIFLAFVRRVVKRLENVHVTSASSFGFVLTPAAGCCDKQDMPPGQDRYYDVAKYSGLTAMTMGWALQKRPQDWQSGPDAIPTDSASNFVYTAGDGRFIQHRGANIYWFMRMQSDYFDARSDMGVAVMKVRNANGTWTDVVPPRPYTGGHQKAADPASPCLVYRKGCAYLELRGGAADAGGGFTFSAIWRTARGTLVRRGTATVTPNVDGLKLTWDARAGDVFNFNNFLPSAQCADTGVTSPGLAFTVAGQTVCRIAKGTYAGGSRVDMRKTQSVALPINGQVYVAYSATSN